jgi:hypothetical protein
MRVAQVQKQRIVPAFTVEELKGERSHTLYSKDEKSGKLVSKEVKVPAGYMVSFPTKGHSIRVANAAELTRLGFDKTIPLVDANSDDDDVVGEIANNVNK